MKIREINGFEATGLSVRTTNANEMDPQKAKIGRLWENFYIDAEPILSQKAKIYGLYTNYHSDADGLFDVIACSDALNAESLVGFVKVKVHPGKYLVFSATGELPQTVIELWREIWDFFGEDDCPYKRAYTTDFEQYEGNKVEIFIAIEQNAVNS